MKIAIVGIGVIAQVHIKALTELGEEIAALCDVDTAKAKQTAEKFGLSCPIYGEYSHLLQELRPDAVHICTPHYLHAPMILEALSQDIHVLCEKPLCIRKEDLPRILEAERRSRATLGVCFQNRYNPANRFVKEWLAEHSLKAAHGSVVWRRTADYYRSADWRGRKATEGGGVMINQAIHTLDLLNWFVGDPSAVTATVSNLSLREVIEVEDTATALFEGKVPFSIFATVASGADQSVCIQLRCEDGARLTLLPHAVLIDDQLCFTEQKQEICGKECYGSSHKRLISDFYNCVRQSRHFPIDGAEGAKSVRLIHGIYESRGQRTQL